MCILKKCACILQFKKFLGPNPASHAAAAAERAPWQASGASAWLPRPRHVGPRPGVLPPAGRSRGPESAAPHLAARGRSRNAGLSVVARGRLARPGKGCSRIAGLPRGRGGRPAPASAERGLSCRAVPARLLPTLQTSPSFLLWARAPVPRGPVPSACGARALGRSRLAQTQRPGLRARQSSAGLSVRLPKAQRPAAPGPEETLGTRAPRVYPAVACRPSPGQRFILPTFLKPKSIKRGRCVYTLRRWTLRRALTMGATVCFSINFQVFV